MDRRDFELLEKKADILVDALPYMRDFNQKLIVIEYDCGYWLTGREEKRLMKDIVLLKSVGMYPIVVHNTEMGVDKFRENKRIAKLLELCGTKAIGICGVDVETLRMTLENDYIPVIVPNDIDNEMENIDPKDTALEIAVKMKADKLIYLSCFEGIYVDETRTKVYPRITVGEVEAMKKIRNFSEPFTGFLDHCISAVHQGVNRAHILDGRIDHVLLIEFFSVAGAGTVIIEDEDELYVHEKELKEI